MKKASAVASVSALALYPVPARATKRSLPSGCRTTQALLKA
jgi:hypothetical protein